MSACRKVTFVNPQALTRASASRREVSERSMEVMAAPGLFSARVTVWAPIPHPASRTRQPGG